MESAADRDARDSSQDPTDSAQPEGTESYIDTARSRQLHVETLDALQARVAVIDQHGTIITVNRAWREAAPDLYGRRVDVGTNYLAVCDKAARTDPGAAGVAGSLREMLAGALASFSAEHPATIKGEDRWFSLRASLLGTDGPARIVLEHYDATARVAAERSARRRSRLLDEIAAAVVASDLDGTIEVWSQGAEELYGWSADEVVGRDGIDVLVPPADRAPARASFGALLEAGHRAAERELVRKDGTTFFAHATTVVYRDDHGQGSGIVNVAVDVTERVQAARELRGARDYLRAVADNMGEALCTLDVEGRVRYMNAAAERTLGWTAAELSGRLLHDSVHFRHPDAAAFAIEDWPLMAAGRSGETVKVEDDRFMRRDGSTIPVAYTSAPFEAEDGTRGLAVVFSDITERRAEQERLRREIALLSQVNELRDALDEDRFVLHAQPIIDLSTGAVFSHELLIRMVERDGSLRSPAGFLPVAEECGLIREIDRWVIRQASELAGAGHRVELNLSASSLGDPELFEEFRAAMEDRNAAPRDVIVELTETALVHDESAAAAFIERIGALGCEFALDDFGTGFGGFGYLKRMPVDYLKIDIDFVHDLCTNAASRLVVEAVVSIAEAFGQRTIAEGVEDEETLALVTRMGVDLAQGYVISRPVPLDESPLALN